MEGRDEEVVRGRGERQVDAEDLSTMSALKEGVDSQAGGPIPGRNPMVEVDRSAVGSPEIDGFSTVAVE